MRNAYYYGIPDNPEYNSSTEKKAQLWRKVCELLTTTRGVGLETLTYQLPITLDMLPNTYCAYFVLYTCYDTI
jgi:hypothetical protein